jgi:hypothetical protein
MGIWINQAEELLPETVTTCFKKGKKFAESRAAKKKNSARVLQKL